MQMHQIVRYTSIQYDVPGDRHKSRTTKSRFALMSASLKWREYKQRRKQVEGIKIMHLQLNSVLKEQGTR